MPSNCNSHSTHNWGKISDLGIGGESLLSEHINVLTLQRIVSSSLLEGSDDIAEQHDVHHQQHRLRVHFRFVPSPSKALNSEFAHNLVALAGRILCS